MADKVRKLKGQMILCSLKPEIRKVFKITGLEKQFKFCDNEKEALAALG
jgi:anti-anti-sigma factor